MNKVVMGVVFALTMAAAAHAQHRAGSWTDGIGDSTLGAEMHASAGGFPTSFFAPEYSATAMLDAKMKIFGASGGVVGSLKAAQTFSYAKLTCLGYTIVSKSGASVTWEDGRYQSLLDVRETFTVGPVPVTVKVSAGGAYFANTRMVSGATPTVGRNDTTNTSATAWPFVPIASNLGTDGLLGMYARGSASAGVDIYAAGAEVELVARFFDTRLTGAFGATSTATIGSAQVKQSALSIEIAIHAWLFAADYYHTIGGWTFGSKTYTLF